jgi:hypothetical protein
LRRSGGAACVAPEKRNRNAAIPLLDMPENVKFMNFIQLAEWTAASSSGA